ncbi:ABC transporter ATP-binding protein [Paracoccus xiamenensis]|uniref:ABC transporter ATP-binding protein n=1 Tax=Paracoccus xiamenensis TaxID=2714901 RepID=UPI00140C7DB5|nr:ATP-binding cassette domain-containing protein [Paracoccus xiamenensis]NHF73509.1 ATP-binding cassette domain-containing protein [Paracoccus xiamenensis]
MLELSGLFLGFGGINVICDLSLRVATGERLVILGPNGAGKTSLLRLIAGEVQPEQGNIWLNYREITGDTVATRARAGIGRGFQQTSLFTGMTLRENLGLACAAGGRRIEDLAAQAGLVDLDRPVAEVDYGTARRLDLALALAGNPRLLLLDEPASGIGPGGAAEIHALIAALPRDLTLVVIEHDLDLAFAIADRIAIMDRGRITFDGPPEAARPALKAIYDT